MKTITPILLVLFLTSCSRTLLSASFAGKMTDSYFKLKKGNKFVSYDRIFGLTKIDKFSGHYTISNDTLHLSYDGDTIPRGLTDRAYINRSKKEFILYGTHGYDQRFTIDFDRRPATKLEIQP